MMWEEAESAVLLGRWAGGRLGSGPRKTRW